MSWIRLPCPVVRAHRDLITHLFQRVPYKKLPREKMKLPERRKAYDYREPDHPFKFIDERY